MAKLTVNINNSETGFNVAWVVSSCTHELLALRISKSIVSPLQNTHCQYPSICLDYREGPQRGGRQPGAVHSCGSDQEFDPPSAMMVLGGPSKSSPIFQLWRQVPALDGDLDSPHRSHLPQQSSAGLPASNPNHVTSGSSTGSIRTARDSGKRARNGLQHLCDCHSHHNVPAAEHPNHPLPALKAFSISQPHAPLSPGAHRRYLWQSDMY